MSTASANAPTQLELLLPELAFPGQRIVTVSEVANRLGLTDQHIINLIEDPECELCAADTSRSGKRAWWRIPVSSYNAWLICCLNKVPTENPILGLDSPVLIKVFVQIATRLQIRGYHPLKVLQDNKAL